MRKLTLAAVSVALLTAASPVDAQDRWSFELRAIGAVPGEDVGSGDLQYSAFGVEGTVRYRFMQHVAAYAGWDWVHFDADEDFALPETEFEETGYVFGLRFEHPFGGESGGPSYWLRAGGTYDHIEVEDADGEVVSDSGHGMGWEVAGGVAVDLGSGWTLTPGLRYRSLARDVEMDAAVVPVKLEYVALEVGFARRF